MCRSLLIYRFCKDGYSTDVWWEFIASSQNLTTKIQCSNYPCPLKVKQTKLSSCLSGLRVSSCLLFLLFFLKTTCIWDSGLFAAKIFIVYFYHQTKLVCHSQLLCAWFTIQWRYKLVFLNMRWSNKFFRMRGFPICRRRICLTWCLSGV